MENQHHFKNVALLITHYNRSLSLERLLTSFRDLGCHFEEIVVSDDCSSPEHFEKLLELQKEFQYQLIAAEKNSGLGNNINKGQDVVSSKYTLYIQEDFIPQSPLPGKLAEALEIMEQTDFDFIRFYSYFKYPYLKPYKNGFSEMIFKFWYRGWKKYWLYSDHPHLRRSNFLERFGRYDEGIGTDKTENRKALTVVQRKPKALFHEADFRGLIVQANDLEGSTVPRVDWRYSNKYPLLVFVRAIYRFLKFSFHYLFIREK